MSKYSRDGVPIFWDTGHQAATVVTETKRPIYKRFNVVNWELNKVYPYQK